MLQENNAGSIKAMYNSTIGLQRVHRPCAPSLVLVSVKARFIIALRRWLQVGDNGFCGESSLLDRDSRHCGGNDALAEYIYRFSQSAREPRHLPKGRDKLTVPFGKIPTQSNTAVMKAPFFFCTFRSKLEGDVVRVIRSCKPPVARRIFTVRACVIS